MSIHGVNGITEVISLGKTSVKDRIVMNRQSSQYGLFRIRFDGLALSKFVGGGIALGTIHAWWKTGTPKPIHGYSNGDQTPNGTAMNRQPSLSRSILLDHVTIIFELSGGNILDHNKRLRVTNTNIHIHKRRN